MDLAVVEPLPAWADVGEDAPLEPQAVATSNNPPSAPPATQREWRFDLPGDRTIVLLTFASTVETTR
jgi:hypothetical protein